MPRKSARLHVGLLCMLFIPVAAAAPAAPQGRINTAIHTLTEQELREWASAVTSHEPGVADLAALQIARWPPGQLYVLFSELRTLAAFRSNPRVKRVPADKQTYPTSGMSPRVIWEALNLTPEETESGNVNRLLQRAALLHTDIALLVPSVFNLPTGSPFSGRITIWTQDGRQTGLSGAFTQLEFASWLLDGVRPDPSADEQVRAWYHAVAAIVLHDRSTGDANWLLRRAYALFPSDATILFYNGALHETLASPELQMARRTADRSITFRIESSSEQQELEGALGFLQRAVGASPAFAEARLHLGHVNGGLAHHEQAAADLTEAAVHVTTTPLQYYAALFLGREQDLLGDLDAARESFARAAALYPRAQSPLLAQSELARRTGDSAGALAPLERLLALPADEMTRDDPWWWYDVSHVTNADDLLSAWRSAVRGRTTR